MKKKSKKQHTIVSISENQFGVILEDINSKIDILIEGQKSSEERLEKNIEEFHEEFVEFKDEMIEFKDEMIEFKDEMISFKQDTESNFKTILQYLLNIDSEIKDIKKQLSQKMSSEKVAYFENRISDLEKDVFNLKKLVLKRA